MHKRLFAVCTALALGTALTVAAQDATPEATMDMSGLMPDGNIVTVRDQASLFGMVTIEQIVMATDGFIAIHSDMNGQPAHVVGIASVPAGTHNNLMVMIDGAMSTPRLYAALHEDTGTIGVFEFEKVPGTDPLVIDVPPQPFTVGAIVAFDQQPVADTVTIASVIMPAVGFVVIHADNGGQPGPVIGFASVGAGTTAPVIVPIDTAAATPVLFAMLHVDDGQTGVYEFDGASGLDNPLVIDGVIATRPMNVTEQPTLLLANGLPLNSANVPSVSAAEQELMAMEDAMSGGLMVDAVSAGPGFVDVHADMGGHPAFSLGHAPVADGENMGVMVPLMPPPLMQAMGMGITPVVWPMLHSDTDGDGEYRYLQIPGVDLPVVYNGAVVAIPVNVTGAMVAPPMDIDGMGMGTDAMGNMITPEATMDMGMDGMMTPEATPGS
jgi:hypothetical protein